jgi:bifunctional ADP-heptose synthase (sugar kinase/adenylyltransferase)
MLRRLQPDIFVKGGDYDAAMLPEAEVMAEWDGRVVVVPYLRGRSTTRIIEEARNERFRSTS